jgi:hypothetical protein
MVLKRVVVFICLIWLGMVLGISFLEAPVKFQAPSVTLSIGLDIGRSVFGMFNKVEIAFGIITLFLIAIIKQRLQEIIPFMIVWALMILQTLWLLPFLNNRVELILQGQTPEDSVLHAVYIVMEMIKAVSLAIYGFRNVLYFRD